MSHIAVERNRRRQMNEHLKVLRSLTPGFYIKRGDQASIIGGAVEFIKELHLVLRSLEAKKKRRRISPSRSPSPRSLMPVTPPAALPPGATVAARSVELGACSSSLAADVEVKISGSNVILRILSKRVPGQASKVISLLEKLSFEVLHINISTMEETALYSFIVKIGLDCKLSVEDLALEVQKCFCPEVPQ